MQGTAQKQFDKGPKKREEKAVQKSLLAFVKLKKPFKPNLDAQSKEPAKDPVKTAKPENAEGGAKESPKSD